MTFLRWTLNLSCLNLGVVAIEKRYLAPLFEEVLDDRMAFVGGPRQVGKTTLSLGLLPPPHSAHNQGYLNWDVAQVRTSLRQGQLPPVTRIVFDEIHKNKSWRSLIKGFYDIEKGTRQFIVTGSARLDHFRRGGDSLFGRYRYFRLHPFSLAEMDADFEASTLNDLLRFGGFPEPLFKGTDKFRNLWSQERRARVVYTDVRDLENVQDLNSLELLADTLASRVGSPLSVENLRQDLGCSHPTVKRWLEILDTLYVSFRIPPFGASRIRAVTKEQKLYLWDWAEVVDAGPRFENLVASQLLKYCHYLEDTQGFKMELRFLRDRDLREIDFVVLKERKPIFAVECKHGDRELSRHIAYFKARTSIPAFYQVHLGKRDFGNALTTGRCLPFAKFCKELKMP